MKFTRTFTIRNPFRSREPTSTFLGSGGKHGEVDHNETITRWTRDTIHTVANSTSRADYDVETLRRLTDKILTPRRDVRPDEVDALVEELIQAHSQKHIAIMATMHKASREVVMANLQRELRANAGSPDGTATALRLVVEAAQGNFAIIARAEVQWADALLALSTAGPEDICGTLKLYSNLLSTNAPAFSVLDMLIATQIQYRACQQFSQVVRDLLRDCRLLEAYGACIWLSQLNLASRFTRMLDEVCQDWRTWAAWRPNESRIQRWATLDSQQRKALADVLRLEGPDHPTGTDSTRMAGVLSRLDSSSEIRCGSTIIMVPERENPSTTLERILAVLDAVIEQDSRSFSAFTKTFLNNTTTTEQVRTLDAALVTKDSSIIAAVLPFIDNTNGSSAGGPLQLISALSKLDERGDQLCELMTPIILEAVPTYLKPGQMEFQDYAEKGMPLESVGMHFANRLYRLKDAAWLVPRLQPDTRDLLHRLVAIDILQAALSLHDTLWQGSDRPTTGLVVMLKAYCRGQLTQQDECSEEEKAFISEMLRTWTHSKNHHHRKAALVLAQATHIPVDIRHSCLSSLPSVSEMLMEAVCEMDNIERACFRITRALAPASSGRGHINEVLPPVNGRWIELLEGLIHSQGADLAQRMCNSLTVKQWFQWQDGLRKLFLDGAGQQQRLSTPLLKRSSLHWSGRLSKEFSRELKLVQEVTNGPQIRHILLQQEDITVIGQLLRAMKLANSNDNIPRPVVVGILSNLRADCSNTQAITDALSRLLFMSAVGIAAAERLVGALAYNRQRNFQDFLSTVPQASELVDSDMRALNCIAAVYV